MAKKCTCPFDEEMISGYLDGALPQVQAQKVRLYVEDCEACRALLEELRTLRETAMSTRFNGPADDEWPELPQTRPGRLSRTMGWVMILAWLVAITGLALWHFFTDAHSPLEILLMLGLPGGLLLLFISVLMDRLRDLKTDRYSGVHR